MLVNVSAKNWNKEVLVPKELVIVDFWHEQCLYCMKLNPIYEELSKEYKGKVKFAKLNIRESHENLHIAQQYGVMGTPTLKFFCKGRVVGEIVGFQPKLNLKKEIDRILEKSKEFLEKSTKIENLGYIG